MEVVEELRRFSLTERLPSFFKIGSGCDKPGHIREVCMTKLPINRFSKMEIKRNTARTRLFMANSENNSNILRLDNIKGLLIDLNNLLGGNQDIQAQRDPRLTNLSSYIHKAINISCFSRDKTKAELDRLLEMKIVIVPTPDGSIRIVADFRDLLISQLNPHQHSILVVDDLLMKLSRKNIVFKDLPLKCYFSGTTRRRSKEFNGAPSIFQRYLESLLFDIPNWASFINDIAVSGSDVEDLLRSYERVSAALQENSAITDLAPVVRETFHVGRYCQKYIANFATKILACWRGIEVQSHPCVKFSANSSIKASGIALEHGNSEEAPHDMQSQPHAERSSLITRSGCCSFKARIQAKFRFTSALHEDVYEDEMKATTTNHQKVLPSSRPKNVLQRFCKKKATEFLETIIVIDETYGPKLWIRIRVDHPTNSQVSVRSPRSIRIFCLDEETEDAIRDAWRRLLPIPRIGDENRL
ncbi:hypothetical protein RF11_04021 [Thelohanellus kitauei]|uniref:Reverse transcriptase domain-containing protein n=1 Tax=Thelohanellus kitauei TaxID=669202 RepID=A0A0C2JIR5_THEKT|nr:hypothetical protein RF11_04021 [Thelohanellus kitauei]